MYPTTTIISFSLKPNFAPTISRGLPFTRSNLTLFRRSINSFSSQSKSEKENALKTHKYNDFLQKTIAPIWFLTVNQAGNPKEILESLKNDSRIEFAEVEQLNVLHYTPYTNDSLLGQLYALEKINAKKAWSFSEGKDVIVAVLDSGIDFRHPDIQVNLWQDEKGYYGRSFVDSPQKIFDVYGHGTHIAGIIAAVRNNKIGTVGVAPQSKIMALKILEENDRILYMASDSAIAKAMVYAVDNGAKIINNSWGPNRRRLAAPILKEAIKYVHSRGGICVFSAGNNNDDASFYAPIHMKEVITVASTTMDDKRAATSNFGKYIDIAAPGEDILSLKNNASSYAYESGTSMATAHVSGAIALLLAQHPNLQFEEIKDLLQKSGDTIQTDKPIGKRLNVFKLLQMASDYQKK